MKKVIIGEVGYADFTSRIKLFLMNANITGCNHIANYQMPDTHITSTDNIYHGYLLCDTDKVEVVKACIKDNLIGTHWYQVGESAAIGDRVKIYETTKTFDLIKCSGNSKSWTTTGKVSDLGKKLKTQS
jgi:hypothetical protein